MKKGMDRRKNLREGLRNREDLVSMLKHLFIAFYPKWCSNQKRGANPRAQALWKFQSPTPKLFEPQISLASLLKFPIDYPSCSNQTEMERSGDGWGYQSPPPSSPACSEMDGETQCQRGPLQIQDLFRMHHPSVMIQIYEKGEDDYDLVLYEAKGDAASRCDWFVLSATKGEEVSYPLEVPKDHWCFHQASAPQWATCHM